MRKSAFVLAAVFALLAGCVTINVYFPAAAAQKAAEQVIGNVMGPDASGRTPPPSSGAQPPPSSGSSSGGRNAPLASRVLDAMIPAASAAETEPNLTIRTPAIDAIQARMRARFHASLKALLDSGVVGFTHNGDVAVRDPAGVPLSERAQVNQTVAAENSDRAQLYQQIADANGHPEWAGRMREAFARQWINMAHPGWYYQDASGNWERK